MHLIVDDVAEVVTIAFALSQLAVLGYPPMCVVVS
jgi:hypothetical protein